MSIEANKQVIKDYFAAINSGNEPAILAMTTDDFVFMTMAVAPDWLLYRWDREQFSGVPSAMSQLMTGPIQLHITDMTAEGDRVAVEAETDSMMLSGKRYNNRYHFVFKLRDGKFFEVREYSCSALASTCFGAIVPDQPELSKMA
jgi:ketosteroid isomerase-like protein